MEATLVMGLLVMDIRTHLELFMEIKLITVIPQQLSRMTTQQLYIILQHTHLNGGDVHF